MSTKLPINLNDLLRQRTVVAKGDTEQELLSLTAKVPFDDRYSQFARINDLSKPLMQAFLQEAGSTLAEDAPGLSVEALARQTPLYKEEVRRAKKLIDRLEQVLLEAQR